MPKRGKLLNQFEQGQARALLDSGYSVAYVARRLKRSHNCTKKFRDRVGCFLKGTGRPEALDQEAYRNGND